MRARKFHIRCSATIGLASNTLEPKLKSSPVFIARLTCAQVSYFLLGNHCNWAKQFQCCWFLERSGLTSAQSRPKVGPKCLLSLACLLSLFSRSEWQGWGLRLAGQPWLAKLGPCRPKLPNAEPDLPWLAPWPAMTSHGQPHAPRGPNLANASFGQPWLAKLDPTSPNLANASFGQPWLAELGHCRPKLANPGFGQPCWPTFSKTILFSMELF